MSLIALQPSTVKLVQRGTRWELQRNGSAYFIRGAAGDHSLAELKKIGGNSTRTWDAENIGPLLDKAQKAGITVTVGFWLGHKEHGFDYQDSAQVKKQYETVKSQLLKWKDHPAVLMWALGNEMEINHDVPEVYRAIGDLAKMVKSIDKSHPVATVFAEITPSKIKHLQEMAPEVDILGINSYGGLPTLPKRLKEAGWKKPYVVTEYGPLGPWESGRTEWGAALEATSTEKAKRYAEEYELTIHGQPGWCLGGYAFLWGWKQETTPTWFGMVLPSGELLETTDVISQAWLGRPPTSRAPQIQSIGFPTGQKLEAGKNIQVTVVASDPNSDRLSYRFEIRKEIGAESYAGEGQKVPSLVGNPVETKESTAQLVLPKEKGAYRLYIYVFDGKGKAATANCPFLIEN